MTAESVPAGRGGRVPDVVLGLAAGRDVRCVWRNEIGGLTFELRGADRRFVRWTPDATTEDLSGEVQRLRWAADYVAVPQVLDLGADDQGAWLLTAAIEGRNAVSACWKARPEMAVTAIGRGLRRLHETLPVTQCPFSWSAEERVADAQRRAAAGAIDPADWHAEHRQLGVAEALAIVENPPGVDRLVVCHGDACAPNTLIATDGQLAGHVDLGALGVADRWADLAVATWSATWNYGPGWEPTLLDAYGIDADRERTDYYRLLWDLGPTGPAARIGNS